MSVLHKGYCLEVLKKLWLNLIKHFANLITWAGWNVLGHDALMEQATVEEGFGAILVANEAGDGVLYDSIPFRRTYEAEIIFTNIGRIPPMQIDFDSGE